MKAFTSTTTIPSELSFYKMNKREFSNENVQPGQSDILCGRCKVVFNHPGNRRFRGVLRKNLPRYDAISGRTTVAALISEITSHIMQGLGFKFLKRQGTGWIELDAKEARKKVGHALRDMSAAQKEVSANRKNLIKSKKIKVSIPKRLEEVEGCGNGTEDESASLFVTSSNLLGASFFSDVPVVSEDEESTLTTEDDSTQSSRSLSFERTIVPSDFPALLRATSIDSMNPRFFHEVFGDENIFEQEFELDLW